MWTATPIAPRVIAASEDRRMDVGVEGLHAAAEHLCDTRELLDALDVEPDLVLEEVCRAAAGDQLEAGLDEPASKLLQTGLVVNGDQRTQSSLTTSGRIRCSAAWMRSTRVARGSTATCS